MRTSSSAVPPTVALVKNKLHGGRGVWKAYEVRNDADGRWLYTPAGSLYRGADGHHLVDCEVEGGDGPGLDSLILGLLSRSIGSHAGECLSVSCTSMSRCAAGTAGPMS